MADLKALLQAFTDAAQGVNGKADARVTMLAWSNYTDALSKAYCSGELVEQSVVDLMVKQDAFIQTVRPDLVQAAAELAAMRAAIEGDYPGLGDPLKLRKQRDDVLEKCAAMEDVVKAASSFEWDEENEAYDTALYRWEKAIAEALQNYSRWQQSQESP